MPRISQLPPAATVTGAELIPVVQDGESRNLPASRFATAEQGTAAAQAAKSVAGLVNWARRRLAFPDWQPVNQQVGAGWPAFQAGLRDMADLAVVEEGLTESNFQCTTQYGYCSPTLMPDGRVFITPYKETSALIYDPVTDSTAPVPGTFASNAFIGAILLQDGRLFMVPFGSTTARIYNPATGEYTTPNGTYPGGFCHLGAVLLPDGRVFMSPTGTLKLCSVYDPVADTVTTYNHNGPDNGFYKCSLMPDGRVFMVPRYSTTPRIFDPVTNTLTTPPGTVWPGNAAYSGVVLLADGRLYCTPAYINRKAGIYDPVTDTLSESNGQYPDINNTYIGGCLLPDGRVWLDPNTTSGTQARVYNPVTDEVEAYGNLPNITKPFYGSCLLQDGRIFMCPWALNAKAMIFGKRSNLAPLPDNRILSPFYNRF